MADVNSSPKYSTVAKRSAEFKRGRGPPTPGRPADVISQEMIERVKVLGNVVFLMEVFTP